MSFGAFTLAEAFTATAASAAHGPSHGAAFIFLAVFTLLWLAKY